MSCRVPGVERNGLDAGPAEEVREHQARRSRPDDGHGDRGDAVHPGIRHGSSWSVIGRPRRTSHLPLTESPRLPPRGNIPGSAARAPAARPPLRPDLGEVARRAAGSVLRCSDPTAELDGDSLGREQDGSPQPADPFGRAVGRDDDAQ